MGYIGKVPADVLIDPHVDSAAITDGTIVTADIANDAVTSAKLAANSVDSSELIDGSVDNSHLAGSIAINKTLLTGGTGLTLSTNTLNVDAAQSQITSVGTLTTLTVDDITINGSTISDSGDLTLDIGADIILDAGGNEIKLKTGGTEWGQIYNSSSDLAIYSSVQDKDIKFQGNDGGSVVTALTLDMSESGAATFNNWVYVDNRVMSASGDIRVGSNDGNEMLHLLAAGTARIDTAGTAALTIDSSQNVTFTGDVTIDTSSHSTLLIKGANNCDAEIALQSDNADDNTDQWSINAKHSTGGTLHFATYGSGAWTNPLILSHTSATFSGTIYSQMSSTSDYGNEAFRTKDGNNYEGVRIQHGGGNGKILLYSSNSHRGTITANQFTSHTNGQILGSTANESCAIMTNNTTRLTIDTGGTVTINPNGVNTSDNNARTLTLGGRPSDSNFVTLGFDSNKTYRGSWDFTANTGDMSYWVYDSSWKQILSMAKDGEVNILNTATSQLRIKSTSSGDGILDLQAGGANDTQVRFYEDSTFKWRLRQNAGGSDRIEIINADGTGASLGYGGNTWGTQSDERIKENLIEITGATEKLNQLRCVNYNYTFDKEREHLGLIAQEVQKIYPEIVDGDPLKEIKETVDDDGVVERKNIMSIEYSSLIPVLVKSIQELSAEIESLKGN